MFGWGDVDRFGDEMSLDILFIKKRKNKNREECTLFFSIMWRDF